MCVCVCICIYNRLSTKTIVFLDELKLLPDASDFQVHWLETKQGRLDPKTGIPPTLYTLTAKHFLTQHG